MSRIVEIVQSIFSGEVVQKPIVYGGEVIHRPSLFAGEGFPIDDRFSISNWFELIFSSNLFLLPLRRLLLLLWLFL